MHSSINKDLLKLIFNYLSLKDRCAAGLVCKEWNEASFLGLHLTESLTIDNTTSVNYVKTRLYWFYR